MTDHYQCGNRIQALEAEIERLRAGIFWRGTEVTRVENIAIVSAPDGTIWLLDRDNPAVLSGEEAKP